MHVCISAHSFSQERSCSGIQLLSPFISYRRCQKSRPTAAKALLCRSSSNTDVYHGITTGVYLDNNELTASATTQPIIVGRVLPQLLQLIRHPCNQQAATQPCFPQSTQRCQDPNSQIYVLLNIIHCYGMCRPRHTCMAVDP